MKDQFFQYIQDLQQRIIAELEAVDGKAKFLKDEWTRDGGGGGLTCVLDDGAVFEKGGVNISKVYGELPETMQKALNVSSGQFFACGLSLVIHPKNPHIPTTHANWRYFEMYDAEGNVVDQWFGGGQDLTPYYLVEEDVIHWHSVCKNSCDKHNEAFYAKYKHECDKYFWNTHREEARGVGGLFFDYLKPTEEMPIENWYDFVTEVGNSFLEAYVPIVEKHIKDEYSETQKQWQEIRRGRYVEFNLIHDRGTIFGLKTNGRIESILMSLPKHVQWHYNHHPEAGSPEAKLVDVLMHPKDWI
ncbi:oxygen-dependent coproporphyrinogen oxidase [Faecalibacter bovis]|uniref:coproporphyrinogen oxidase n=1 Tax=Faecalibacter bovis TaxID=2898187 RepID=A0ABX7XD59_9FLAO|nr:oxygen-dependent coproporphyrinogen oxidase [Faecalibacter bovis]QTV05862.1 oxygen-dependent coproporphyrinogen oxidase [Faecalibacter bovis]